MDQNDNRPVFLQEVFTGLVPEGAAPGESRGAPAGALGGSDVCGIPSARISEKVNKKLPGRRNVCR